MFAPCDSWQFWSGGVINLSRFGEEAVIRGDNQSLTGAFMRLSRDLSPPPILILLLSCGAMALGLVAAKRQIDSDNDVAALVSIAFASLLSSPISWTHHWIWVVPALMVFVQARRRVAAALLALIFVTGPMWFAPRGLLLELNHNWWQAAVCVSYVFVGLACLIVLSVRQPWSSSRGSAGSGSIGPGSDGQVTAAIKNAPLTSK